MPLSDPNFTTTQSASDPSTITLTDSSTGSDVGLTARRILIQLANGNYLTTSGEVTALTYIAWPIADANITLSVLPRSESPRIRVDWMTNTVATYTKTKTICFDLADYIFGLGLTMRQVANNNVTQDANWYGNKMQLIVNTNDAENAILYINDITLSQNSLDRNYFMIQNAGKFF